MTNKEVLVMYAVEELKIDQHAKIDLRELIPFNCSPWDIEKILESHSWEREALETNGWQCDCWITYSNPDFDFDIVISYSGFYGDLEIYRSDIDDD